MSKITHLIYDFDGLLLDTEPIYTKVNQMIAKRYGKTFTRDIHRMIMGRQAMDCAQILVKVLELPLTPEEHLAARDELIFDLLPAAEPMPGAMEITQRFYEQGVPQAIATSSAKRTFDLKTQRHRDWLTLFDVIVLGDDPAVKRSKPAPDSFLAAADKLSVDPENCLVFEDAPSGVQAAKAAGMSVIAVPAAYMDKQAYSLADKVIDSLSAFDASHWSIAPRTNLSANH